MIMLMVTNTDDDERMVGCYNTQVKDEEKRMVMILKQRRMTVSHLVGIPLFSEKKNRLILDRRDRLFVFLFLF